MNSEYFLARLSVDLLDDTAQVFCALYNGTPAGATAVCLHTDPFTGQPYGSQLFMYVIEKYRGLPLYRRLLTASEDWCRMHGVKFMLSTLPSSSLIDYSALWRRAGYVSKTTTTLVKEL